MHSSTRARGKKKLEIVSEIVRYGGTVRMPIWTLLGWFEYERRGYVGVGGISRILKECQLETRPDFADLDLDIIETVEFRDISQEAPTIDSSP